MATSQARAAMPAPGPVSPNVLVITGRSARRVQSDGSSGPSGIDATPALDRLVRTGVRLTRWCSAPEAPASAAGWPDAAAAAGYLRAAGYATGRFGLDDFRHHPEAVTAFDESFGPAGCASLPPAGARNAMTAEGESGARSVVHCWSDGNGGQRVLDRGVLSATRRATIDRECLEAAVDFIVRQNLARRPFFTWFAATTGDSTSAGECPPDTCSDRLVAGFLDQLEHLDLARNTIVVCVASPVMDNTDAEAPCLLRWPGQIPAGSVSDCLCGPQDLLPTILAAAGVAPDGGVDRTTPSGEPDRPGGINLLPVLGARGYSPGTQATPTPRVPAGHHRRPVPRVPPS